MDERVKELWVSALRSGDYKQTTKSLANNGGFCCLGVLCEVAVNEKAIPGYWPGSPALPWEVETWAGLDSDDPLVDVTEGFTERTVATPLSGCNDNLLLNFDQIAELIERSL